MRPIAPVFLACLSLATALARARSDDVLATGGEPRALLHLALVPEQTFAYRWSSAESTNRPQPPAKTPKPMADHVRTTTLDLAFRVEKVADGCITLRCRFLRLTFDNPGAPEGYDKYDSDDPAVENDLVFSIAVLIGRSVLLDVAPTGKITGVSLGDLHAQIVKAMSAEARKRNEPPSVEETLRDEVNETAIARLVKRVLPRFPGVAVGAGARWTVDRTEKEPAALVCELKWLNETAVVDLGRERDESQLLDNMAGFMQEVLINPHETTKGRVEVERPTGLVRESIITVTSSGTISGRTPEAMKIEHVARHTVSRIPVPADLRW